MQAATPKGDSRAGRKSFRRASKNAHEVVQLFFRENFDQKDYDIVRAFWQTQNITLPAAPAPSEQVRTESSNRGTAITEMNAASGTRHENVSSWRSTPIA